MAAPTAISGMSHGNRPSNRDRRPAPQASAAAASPPGGFLLAALLALRLRRRRCASPAISGWRSAGRRLQTPCLGDRPQRPGRGPGPVDDGTLDRRRHQGCRSRRLPRPRPPTKRKLAAVSADRVGLGGPDPGMVERSTYLLCGATPQAAAPLRELLARLVHARPSRSTRHDFQQGLAASLLDQGQRRGTGAAGMPPEASGSGRPSPTTSTRRRAKWRRCTTTSPPRSARSSPTASSMPERLRRFLGLGIPTEIGSHDRRRAAASAKLCG